MCIFLISNFKNIKYDHTAHNKRYTFRRLWRLQAPKNRSRAIRPLWRFLPPHFASPGLCFARPLFGLAKRRIPETLSEMSLKNL